MVPESRITVNLSKTAVLHLGALPYKDYTLNGSPISRRNEARDQWCFSGFQTQVFESYHLHCWKSSQDVVSKLSQNTFHCSPNTYSFVWVLFSASNWILFPSLESDLVKHIRKIGSIQQTSTRILLNKIYPSNDYPGTLPSYEQRLKILNMNILKLRSLVRDLVFAFRILKLEPRLRSSMYWIFGPSHARRGRLTPYLKMLLTNPCSSYYNSFFVRTATSLLMLPMELLKSTSGPLSRKALKKVNLSGELELPELWFFWSGHCGKQIVLFLIALP